MSPLWGNLVGVITLAMMVLFIGIWIWAWRKRHKAVFDRMAVLPMEDEIDDSGGKKSNTGGKQDE